MKIGYTPFKWFEINYICSILSSLWYISLNLSFILRACLISKRISASQYTVIRTKSSAISTFIDSIGFSSVLSIASEIDNSTPIASIALRSSLLIFEKYGGRDTAVFFFRVSL